MKKLIVIFVLAITFSIALSSCRSSKPPCPAYHSLNIQQIISNFFYLK